MYVKKEYIGSVVGNSNHEHPFSSSVQYNVIVCYDCRVTKFRCLHIRNENVSVDTGPVNRHHTPESFYRGVRWYR